MLRHRFGSSAPTPPATPDALNGAPGTSTPAATPMAPFVEPPMVPPALQATRVLLHERLIEELDQDHISRLSPEDARRTLRDDAAAILAQQDRKSTRLNSSH